MTKKNRLLGSTFESWLDAQGVREEVTAAAIKQIIAEQEAQGRQQNAHGRNDGDEPRSG